ncbi:hypothetical protein [Pseudosulfitobacter sp. DSM 107133]|uniref:hypothetical protein n=1 Tax=Pseudosulfitobacter sp. DSM 107133 TaxID=2883100 RepID=UPI000DF2FE0D|nr:hypothetical protein [Pseudosulfitobacter sp. DSM 107133]UOA28666.1 hypothetical protein DSM107133_03416 [Pseudosulfitobacter sp. DSM 107133]
MPGGKKATSVDEDVLGTEQLLEDDSAEILRQSDRFRTVRRLVDLFSYLEISREDTEILENALLNAQTDRRKSDPQQNASIMPYLVRSLAQNGVVERETDGSIPDLSEAPRDSFRGVNVDGDAFEYLLKTYGAWLQDGKKCLDRPSATQLDGKLVKALQQKYTRNRRSMPPLSEVFPTVTEARAIREKFGIAGL